MSIFQISSQILFLVYAYRTASPILEDLSTASSKEWSHSKKASKSAFACFWRSWYFSSGDLSRIISSIYTVVPPARSTIIFHSPEQRGQQFIRTPAVDLNPDTSWQIDGHRRWAWYWQRNRRYLLFRREPGENRICFRRGGDVSLRLLSYPIAKSWQWNLMLPAPFLPW